MQTDITVWTSKGPVVLAIADGSFFNLKGSEESIQEVQALVPVLQKTGNPLEYAPDAIGRLLFIEAADYGSKEPFELKLVSHKEMQERTYTENPLVFLQRKDESLAKMEDLFKSMSEKYGIDEFDQEHETFEEIKDGYDGWKTERVFIDMQEAEQFIAAQKYRYPSNEVNETWRFYIGIADGTLKRIVKEARDLANL